MSTATMPTTVERFEPMPTKDVGQLMPFLLAIAMLAASAVIFVLISGPMH